MASATQQQARCRAQVAGLQGHVSVTGERVTSANGRQFQFRQPLGQSFEFVARRAHDRAEFEQDAFRLATHVGAHLRQPIARLQDLVGFNEDTLATLRAIMGEPAHAP